MKAYLSLIRIQQWVKNLFIFAPLFFSGNITHESYYLNAGLTFLCFSFLASFVYIINDYRDIDLDRLHPTKKKRALASGAIQTNTALLFGALLLTASFGIAFLVNTTLIYCLAVYLLLNLAYSFWLKYISIIDVVVVSLGFVLRVCTGGYVFEIEVSPWLVIMTFLLALFIVIAKRRDDIHLESTNQVKLRKSISGYNEAYINVCLGILLAILIVSYLLYVTAPETALRYSGKPLYISTIFVIVGVLRYLQITLVENKSGSPTKIIFTDLFTQVNLIMWILFFVIIIYY